MAVTRLDDESRRRQVSDAALKKLQDKLAFDLQAGDDVSTVCYDTTIRSI